MTAVRRRIIAAGVVTTVALVGAGCWLFGGDTVIRLSRAQVQTALDLRFPVAKTHLGLINLAYHDPEVQLEEGSDRIGIGMSITISAGTRDESRAYSGRAHIVTGIGYDADSALVILEEPVLDSLSLGRLTVGYVEQASELARRLALERLDRIPIYDLRERGFGRRAARMVLKDVAVEDGHLVITLGRSRDSQAGAGEPSGAVVALGPEPAATALATEPAALAPEPGVAVPGGEPEVTARLFGGSRADDPFGCLIDARGNLRVVGQTRSPDFPRTHGPPHSDGRGLDGFLLELDPDGEVLTSRLFVGGKRDDALGVAQDAAGALYIVGTTSSRDFPTTAGAYDRTYNGGDYGDAFAMKLDAAGNVLWSTLLGGSRPDNSRGVLAVDAEGRLYVGGRTESPDFPTTPGAYGCRAGPPECKVRIPHNGTADAYVSRLSADGSRLEVSTLYGGAGDEAFFGGLTLLPDGGVLGGGVTSSPDLPMTAEAFDPTYNGTCRGCRAGDAFVAVLSPDLDELRRATYLGGADREIPGNKTHVRLDETGRMYVLGHTASPDFPVMETAFQSELVKAGEYDVYVIVLSPDWSELLASTLLGGSGGEEASGLALRSDGTVVITGEARGRDFPTTAKAAQPRFGGGPNDVFLSVLSPDLSSLVYSTFWGGSGGVRRPHEWGDINRCLAAAPDGGLFTIGYTSSRDFPTTAGPPHAGVNDGYLIRLHLPDEETPAPPGP